MGHFHCGRERQDTGFGLKTHKGRSPKLVTHSIGESTRGRAAAQAGCSGAPPADSEVRVGAHGVALGSASVPDFCGWETA